MEFKLQDKKICVVICAIAVVLLMAIIRLRCDVVDNDESNNDATEPIITDAIESSPIETADTTLDNAKDEIVIEWQYNDNLSAEENIFIYLTEYLMFPNASACGIISNIAYETGWTFDPSAGDQSYNYGLIQWMGSRLSNLKTWCEENDKDYTTIQGQLDFMYWELINNDPYGTYDYLMQCEDNIDDAYNAGWYFCYWYERPYNKDAGAISRGNHAKEYYESLVLGQD